jgi:hypothetical protein
VGVGNGATDDSTWARRRKLRTQTRVFLGACPRTEVVARGSHFESSFSII